MTDKSHDFLHENKQYAETSFMAIADRPGLMVGFVGGG